MLKLLSCDCWYFKHGFLWVVHQQPMLKPLDEMQNCHFPSKNHKNAQLKLHFIASFSYNTSVFGIIQHLIYRFSFLTQFSKMSCKTLIAWVHSIVLLHSNAKSNLPFKAHIEQRILMLIIIPFFSAFSKLSKNMFFLHDIRNNIYIIFSIYHTKLMYLWVINCTDCAWKQI